MKSIPYLDIPGSPVHEDPFHPITKAGKDLIANTAEDHVPIAWWPRKERYAERLAPGTKFADVGPRPAPPCAAATRRR